ncbi:PBP1A family penicillin-binding protein [candidate division TA06 bacterium]|nr:PBP1A family penicillin-binding protein [candidate division TA06 bacterium]
MKRFEKYFSWNSLLLLFFLLFSFLSGGIFTWVKALARVLPPPSVLERYDPPLSTRLYDLKEEQIAEFYFERRNPVVLSKIPPHLIAATVSLEDRRFYRHWGVDLRGVARALLKNILAGRAVQGAGTITQQLSRNLFLTPERTLTRKLKETLLAIQIEKIYPKNKILEMYLNQIYYGHRAYGVAASARIFFGKEVHQLTLSESALLAGISRSPALYSPFRHPERALRRRAITLRAMAETGTISREVALRAENGPLGVVTQRVFKSYAPYFVEEVRKTLESRYGTDFVYRSGAKVSTTLDIRLQKIADRVLLEGLQKLEEKYNLWVPITQDKEGNPLSDTIFFDKDKPLQGALIALDPKTGYILAMVGGRNFVESQFNRALQARRQPGSAFKPFVYTTAIQHGYTPADILLDAPIIIEDGNTIYAPHNYDRKFLGPISLRRALALSRNLFTVRLFQEVGAREVVLTARRMGIKNPLLPVPSLALGSPSLTLIEMVSAYSVLANQGFYVEPSLIRRIRDHKGALLFQKEPEPERALDPQTAYIITHMMKSVIEEGTGLGVRWRGFTRPAAGKTGTTNDYSDAWFIGFIPDLVVGVWVGFDQMRRIARGATGSRFALPIWTEFMKEATKGKAPQDFPVPEGIVYREVCVETGRLATPRCEKRRNEVFIAGTEPNGPCPRHQPEISPQDLKDPHLFEELDRRKLRDYGSWKGKRAILRRESREPRFGEDAEDQRTPEHPPQEDTTQGQEKDVEEGP